MVLAHHLSSMRAKIYIAHQKIINHAVNLSAFFSNTDKYILAFSQVSVYASPPPLCVCMCMHMHAQPPWGSNQSMLGHRYPATKLFLQPLTLIHSENSIYFLVYLFFCC